MTQIVVAIAVFTLGLSAQAQDTARMDQVVRELVDSKQFMDAVLVARGDQLVFGKAYGDAKIS